jgi:hypothetical protein
MDKKYNEVNSNVFEMNLQGLNLNIVTDCNKNYYISNGRKVGYITYDNSRKRYFLSGAVEEKEDEINTLKTIVNGVDGIVTDFDDEYVHCDFKTKTENYYDVEIPRIAISGKIEIGTKVMVTVG